MLDIVIHKKGSFRGRLDDASKGLVDGFPWNGRAYDNNTDSVVGLLLLLSL